VIASVALHLHVDQATANALRARATRDGHSVEHEARIALTEHLGHQRLTGELRHPHDIASDFEQHLPARPEEYC
jgi:plasmid stability protein